MNETNKFNPMDLFNKMNTLTPAMRIDWIMRRHCNSTSVRKLYIQQGDEKQFEELIYATIAVNLNPQIKLQQNISEIG